MARLLHAHGIVMRSARDGARGPRRAATTAPTILLVSDVIRQNGQQVSFLAEHVVDVPLVARHRRPRNGAAEVDATSSAPVPALAEPV